MRSILILIGYIVQSRADQVSLPKLPALEANPNSITISGFSAGAWMTNQMHVAFSDIFKGAGMIAGGPYQALPPKPHFKNLLDTNDEPSQISRKSVEKMKNNFIDQKIDDPVNLKNAPVYVGIDEKDAAVSPTYQESLKLFYEGTDSNLMHEEYDVGHMIVDKSHGGDMIGKIFRHVLTNV